VSFLRLIYYGTVTRLHWHFVRRIIVVGKLSIIAAALILTGTMFALSLTSPDKIQSDNVTAPEVQDIIAGGYSANISSLLEEAGNEITDEDIAEYYQQLCDGYGLDEQPSATAHQEPPAVTDIVPVENINRTALSSILEGAGSDIGDNEIAEFYYQFLDKAGWEIESKE
jgi:hypothetical protein